MTSISLPRVFVTPCPCDSSGLRHVDQIPPQQVDGLVDRRFLLMVVNA